jgi:exosortase H (IPTLxxWG-CTERM-specific)
MKRFIIYYTILLLIGLTTIEFLLPQWFHHNFSLILATITGWIVHIFNADISIIDTVIRHPNNGFAIQVTKDCNGLNFTVLLFGAIIAFTAHWKLKIFACIFSFLAIQIVNILRLVSLVFIGKFYPDYFNWIHDNLWPLFFSADIALLFFGYLYMLNKYSYKYESATSI